MFAASLIGECLSSVCGLAHACTHARRRLAIVFELGIEKGEAAELLLRNRANHRRLGGRQRRLLLGEVGVEIVDVAFALLQIIARLYFSLQKKVPIISGDDSPPPAPLFSSLLWSQPRGKRNRGGFENVRFAA